jgi:hypothetical protein
MAPFRICSPSASAALILLDLLSDYGATATQEADGRWEIAVPLNGSDIVPQTLAVARAWLDECGISSAQITLDGHTHLLRSGRPEQRAMH